MTLQHRLHQAEMIYLANFPGVLIFEAYALQMFG